MASDYFFTVMIFILFFAYGASNLYIIIYLRKNDNYVIGLIEFVHIFMGNIKNYLELNRRYRKKLHLKKNSLHIREFISIIHLLSPILIPLFILFWIVDIGI